MHTRYPCSYARLAARTLWLALLVQMPEAIAHDDNSSTVAGWVETGWIGEPPIKVKVKLDTGARTSSIHAAQVRDYEKGGKRYVSFSLTNNEGAILKLDSEVVRTATIRRAGTELQERPVIRLKICIAGQSRETEFTMADRSDLTYPVLVGRSFLAGNIVVDSSRTFLSADTCTKQ